MDTRVIQLMTMIIAKNPGENEFHQAVQEVAERLQTIMKNIHKSYVKYSIKENGFINYADGANIGGSVKVANAMMAQGVV